MDLKENSSEHRFRHPWELSRLDFVQKLIAPHITEVPLNVLDVGSGDAWLAKNILSHLPTSSTMTCWDQGYTTDVVARIEASQGSQIYFTSNPPDKKFDLILLLDVLEHVPDAHSFLKAILDQSAHPNTTVIVTVPAWPFLFSAHDEFLGHYRRYRPQDLNELLKSCGLRVQSAGGLFSSLFIARTLQLFLKKITSQKETVGVQNWNDDGLKTKFIRLILNLDASFGKFLSQIGFRAPGLSCWSVSKK